MTRDALSKHFRMNHVPPTGPFFLPPISYLLPRGHILHIRIRLSPAATLKRDSGRGVLVPESPISRIPTGAVGLPGDCDKREVRYKNTDIRSAQLFRAKMERMSKSMSVLLSCKRLIASRIKVHIFKKKQREIFMYNY